ncbi:PHA/PHB synthase family protein [Undibacterium sp. WLHG33]|uniref:PHA/PHB synthase family protein n=1 Tax=Undibacterium sp. WLHG33 TaxID=3412482 RepID=UPI003C2E6B36
MSTNKPSQDKITSPPAKKEHHDQICYLTGEEAPVNPMDMALQNHIAKLTGGISPASVNLAWADWAMHLAATPGKQMELVGLLQKQAAEWPAFIRTTVLNHNAATATTAAATTGTTETPTYATPASTSDTRFSHAGWTQWPFNAMSKAFLQTQDFWNTATTGIRGVTAHHEDIVNFMARQFLDMASPSNIPWANPEVIEASQQSGGKNILSGFMHWLEDVGINLPSGEYKDNDEEQAPFKPGRDVAVTPGKVVFRNHLIELIQYSPQTPKVYAEPIFIVPSWIMKYYILDLSPHNSMVRFLVEQGHTVFMISWRNPGREDRDLGMDDYLDSGLFTALREVHAISKKPLHAVGYCLGGTLLAIGAAALAGQKMHGEKPHATMVSSITLLAAQTDFSEPGELGLFIDESQLAMLDALMWKQGYLDGKQMAGSFQLLNSRDLIWSKIMRDYQLGLRNKPNDLMSWNADTTRMPYRMHSEYLKHLFLHNDLAKGHYEVHQHAVALRDIQIPMFVVGTVKDHVSPWRSVYKIHVLTDTSIDFVLASGGHNAGIVSEPGHAHRSYQFLPSKGHGASYEDPNVWLKEAQTEQGSWWTYWQQWLVRHSSATQIKASQPRHNPDLGDAPGQYIFET